MIQPDKELPQQILEICKNPGQYTYEGLSTQLDIGMGRVREAVERLRMDGYGFNVIDGDIVRTKTIVPKQRPVNHTGFFDGEHIILGIKSDDHLGSKKERPDIAEQIYDVFVREGVTRVYHAGDVTEGVGVYRGQENEILMFGTDAQVQHAVAKYPKRDGITTHYITGNHDLRAFERGGADPGVMIAAMRRDMDYLGPIQARIDVAEGIDLELLHPAGGQAYAKSYKGQRMIDNRPIGERPKILVFGHYHTSFYMDHGGVQFIQCPATKEHGLFEKRLGLQGNLGAWIVEMTVRDGVIRRFKPELLRVRDDKVDF